MSCVCAIGLSELLSPGGVFPRQAPAGFGRAHRSPDDSVSRARQALQRRLQPVRPGQQRVGSDFNAVHHNPAGGGRAQRKFSLDRRGGQSAHAFFQNESPRSPVVRVGLRPNDEEVGDGAVGNPRLFAVQPKAAAGFFGAGTHRAGVGSAVGLGESEAADEFARRHSREIFALLRVVAEGENGMHRQRRLHRHRGAVAGIHPLYFARDESLGDRPDRRAAELRGKRRPEKSARAHFRNQFAVKALFAEGGNDSRREDGLRKVARGVAHLPLVGGKLLLQKQRVVGMKSGSHFFSGGKGRESCRPTFKHRVKPRNRRW